MELKLKFIGTLAVSSHVCTHVQESSPPTHTLRVVGNEHTYSPNGSPVVMSRGTSSTCALWYQEPYNFFSAGHITIN